MTSKEKIEKLLNYYGDTLNDLPSPSDDRYAYHPTDLNNAYERATEWSFGIKNLRVTESSLADFICHQSDIIEKLVKALESAELKSKAGQSQSSDVSNENTRGKRADLVGFAVEEGIVWINFVDRTIELERF